MMVETQLMDEIFTQVQQLSEKNRFLLMRRILETFRPTETNQTPQLIQFGEFSGDESSMSTWEDFKIAEWYPENEDWYGS